MSPDPVRRTIGKASVRPHHVIDKVSEAIDRIKAADQSLKTAKGTQHVRDLNLIGMLISFCAIKEAVDVLCDLDPKFESVRDRHKKTFANWCEMRHDAAHYIERMFRKRPGRDPSIMINGEEWLRVVEYDPKYGKQGEIRTGKHVLVIDDAIREAEDVRDSLVMNDPESQRKFSLKISG